MRRSLSDSLSILIFSSADIRTGKTGSVSIFLPLLIDPLCFLGMGVSRDAERNGEVQNGFTSCFAHQTGSAHIFLSVIDWFDLGFKLEKAQINQ